MVKSPKLFWKLGKIPSFKSDFEKLPPYEKWVVGKTIRSMLYMKDPTRVYRCTICNDCNPVLYLFGILDDGIGNKGFELQISLDKKRKILSPITVRKVNTT